MAMMKAGYSTSGLAINSGIRKMENIEAQNNHNCFCSRDLKSCNCTSLENDEVWTPQDEQLAKVGIIPGQANL